MPVVWRVIIISLVPSSSFSFLLPLSTKSVAKDQIFSSKCRDGFHRGTLAPLRMADSSDKDSGDDLSGMSDAFKQLGSLESLGDSSGTPEQPPEGIQASVDTPKVQPPSIEEEANKYTKLAEEVENQTEDDLYEDMLAGMGGSSVPKVAPDQDSPSYETNEDFMNQALQEAMDEVELNNPSISQSILDDKDIMKEIEAIFEKGNEKLVEGLEEVRREQKELAKASADASAKENAESTSDVAERLAVAEKSMVKMLGKVSAETSQVEAAVNELKQAQAELEKDPLMKLRAGGIVKQAALAGFLLFSFRSISDSISAIGGNSDMTLALAQGLIAVVCAVAFFFL